jgi:hypothetical protein
MGGFRTIAILAAGAAVGGALMIAHRVSEDTGKTLTESFGDVPAEAQRIFGDVKSRANDAVSKARQTYEGNLHGGGPAV